MLVPEPSMLLSRIASTLEQDVLPQMRPSYACTEVEAAVAMLRNLAGRVEWRQDDLSDDLARADEALRAIAGGPANESGARPTLPTFEALHDSRERLGADIDQLFRGDDPPVAALVAVLGQMVDADEERNRRGL